MLFCEIFKQASYQPLSRELRQYIRSLNVLENDKNALALTKSNPPIPELAKGGLKALSGGSHRAAFLLNDDYVIKVAKKPSGVENNAQEAKVSACTNQHPQFFARVVDWDKDDYLWIVMEALGKTAMNDFGSGKDEFGTSVDFIRWVAASMGEEAFEIGLEGAQERFESFADADTTDVLKLNFSKWYLAKILKLSPWFTAYYNAIRSCGVDPQDLHPDNWALRKDGSWAIVDYGF